MSSIIALICRTSSKDSAEYSFKAMNRSTMISYLECLLKGHGSYAFPKMNNVFRSIVTEQE